MPASTTTIAAKDGAGATIAGGLIAQDKSGAGTGPFAAAHVLVDAQGVNVATVTAANALKIDGSAVTQPVSLASTTITGTVAATQSGTYTVRSVGNAGAVMDFAGQNAAAPANSLLVGAEFNTTPTTLTSGNASPLQLDSAGNLLVNVKAGGAAGGTSSTVGSAAPSTATAAGFTDGTNMVLAKVKAASSGAAAATDPALVVTLRDVNANGQTTMSASAPVTIASDQSAVKTLQSVSATANGLTASRVVAAASTNATSLKASAGQLYEIDVFNVAAYTVFLKLYNKASAPTVGTDTPVWTIPVPAGGGYARSFQAGRAFTTGVAYAITKLQADSDTTVVAAGDLTGSIAWI